MALREAVDEQDFGPIRIAPVLRRNGEAVGRLHRDRLELSFLRLAGRCKSHEKRRDRHSGKVVPTRCIDHYRPPSLPMRVRTGEAMKRSSCSLDQTEAIVRPQRALSTLAEQERPAYGLPHSIGSTFLIEFKPFPGV